MKIRGSIQHIFERIDTWKERSQQGFSILRPSNTTGGPLLCLGKYDAVGLCSGTAHGRQTLQQTVLRIWCRDGSCSCPTPHQAGAPPPLFTLCSPARHTRGCFCEPFPACMAGGSVFACLDMHIGLQARATALVCVPLC